MNHHAAFLDLFKHAPSSEAVEDAFSAYQQASKTLAERRQRLTALLQQRSQAEQEVARATGSDRTEVVTKLMLAQTELTAMPTAIAEAAHAEVLARLAYLSHVAGFAQDQKAHFDALLEPLQLAMRPFVRLLQARIHSTLAATEEQANQAQAALAELRKQAESLVHAQQAAEMAFGVAVAGLRGMTDTGGAGAWTFEISHMYWLQAAERVSTAARVAAARQIASASMIGDALRPLTTTGVPA